MITNNTRFTPICAPFAPYDNPNNNIYPPLCLRLPTNNYRQQDLPENTYHCHGHAIFNRFFDETPSEKLKFSRYQKNDVDFYTENQLPPMTMPMIRRHWLIFAVGILWRPLLFSTTQQRFSATLLVETTRDADFIIDESCQQNRQRRNGYGR